MTPYVKGFLTVGAVGAVALVGWLLQREAPGPDRALVDSGATSTLEDGAASDVATEGGTTEQAAAQTDDAGDGLTEEAPAETANAALPEAESDDEAVAEATDATGDEDPVFDLVRVEPGGSALFAGRARPDAKLALLLDGEEMANTNTDASGSFVMFAELGPSGGPRALTVVETLADGSSRVSGTSVILGPVPENPIPVASVPDVTEEDTPEVPQVAAAETGAVPPADVATGEGDTDVALLDTDPADVPVAEDVTVTETGEADTEAAPVVASAQADTDTPAATDEPTAPTVLLA
ncbi:MAG: hypothetical protein AAF222_12160, partial [Pseudomonadota bacterium]